MRRGAAQRRYRRRYQRITWREIEQAFETLFSKPRESPEVGQILRRFKQSRRQVMPVFLQMIQGVDAEERETAAFIIERLGQGAVRPLKKVATDPDVSEVARLEIQALVEKLEGRRTGTPAQPGVPVPGEEEVAVAADGVDPALLKELAGQPDQFLQGLEDETILAEVLDRLTDLSPTDQVSFVKKLAALEDERALRLLMPLLSVEEDELLAAVLQALPRIPTEKTLPPLRSLVEETSRKRTRILANRAIREIERAVIRGGKEERRRGRHKRKARISEAPLPFYRAYATEISGDGEQTLVLAREHPDRSLQVLLAIHSDLYGLLEIRGWEKMEREEFQDIVKEWRAMGRVPVEVSLTYCREILQQTEKHTRRRERPLPDDYQQWAPMLESASSGRQNASAHIDFAEAVDPQALERSAGLVERPEFLTWGFPPQELAGYLPAAPTGGRSGTHNAAGYEAAAARFLAQRMTRRQGVLLRVRLLRQAWLLRRAGREEDAEAAIAAATALLKEHKINPQDHPFLRALAVRSLAAQIPSGEPVEVQNQPQEAQADEGAAAGGKPKARGGRRRTRRGKRRSGSGGQETG